MTRTRLLALLAAALATSIAACEPEDEVDLDAEAPTPDPGEITFPTVANSAVDGFINVAECRAGTIRFKARFPVGTSFTSYQLYAANDDAVFDPDNPEECQLTVTGNDQYVVNTVGGERSDNIIGDIITDASYATSLITAAVGQSACSSSTDIFLCMQARGTTAKVGTALTTLRLVVDKPRQPVLQSVTPAEGGLKVDWDAPNPGAGESYAVVTRTTDRLDPDVVGTTEVVRTSRRVTATELRVEGLTNGADYTVEVVAFSDADNPSDPSDERIGSPAAATDFWEAYSADGREQGGCGTTGAGPLTLLAAALLLVLRRRT